MKTVALSGPDRSWASTPVRVTMKPMNPRLTREQVRRVDRLAIDEYGIAGLVLMENAGRNAAEMILKILCGADGTRRPSPPERTLIFCGTGNNGGDGFVIARHLVNAGRPVQLVLVGEQSRLTPDAAANHRICRAMKIPLAPPDAVTILPSDLVVDALLGTGFTGEVRPPLAAVIGTINAAPHAGVIAIDLPSGLDADTGLPANACIRADVTLTFVAEKLGFASVNAAGYLGRLHVLDIGAPPWLIDQVLVLQREDQSP